MKLPTRGFLANEDGQIVWAWEHNDPNTEFEALPPFRVTLDGQVSTLASPGAVVVDLDEHELAPEDLAALVCDLTSARLRRRADGSLRLTKVLPAREGSSVEIEHPVMEVINARRAQRGKVPLKKGE